MSQLRRLAPLSGLLAAALWVVSVLVLEGGGNPPDPDATDVVAAHFRDHRDAILISGTLHVLGGFFFLWFVAVVATLLEGMDPSIRWIRTAALVGGAAAGAMMLALTGPQTTGATTDLELLGAESSVAFWRLSHTFFIGAEFALAVFVSALALAALAGHLVPRWLGWAGLAITLVLLVPPIGWIGLLLLVPLWLGTVSAILFVRGRRVIVAD